MDIAGSVYLCLDNLSYLILFLLRCNRFSQLACLGLNLALALVLSGSDSPQQAKKHCDTRTVEGSGVGQQG